MRKFLSNIFLIHFEVFLGLFALLGYLMKGNKFLIFFTVLSFAGAICGAFVRVIDTIKNTN